jgi:hypothetical protein
LRGRPQQSPWMEIQGFVKEEGVGGLLGLTGHGGTIYPGSGPFVEGKTPTPACLIDIPVR